MKYCPKCKIDKENKEFNLKTSSKDGLHNKCRLCMKIQNKEWYKGKRIEKIEYAKQYQKRESIKQYQNEYSRLNHRNYYDKNKKHILEYGRKYTRNRYHTDASFKLSLLLRTRFHHALKGGYKIHSIIKLLGCTVEECRQHLESQFKPEMTWENHGKVWEIDHIKPCSLFDLIKEEEQHECFHYSNLQPLFKKDNRVKSNKYDKK